MQNRQQSGDLRLLANTTLHC